MDQGVVLIQARIISVLPPTPNGMEPTGPWSAMSYRHSKYVIRRQYVLDALTPQIADMGLPVEVFDAVTDADYIRQRDVITYRDLCLPVVCGYISCYLSHIMLWRRCVAEDITLLVLEDDALLPETSQNTVFQALCDYDAMPDCGALLYLQGQIPYLEVGIHNYPANTLTKAGSRLNRVWPIKDMAGTSAYAIRPKAARTLLDKVPSLPTTATDEFIHNAVNASEIGVLVPDDFAHVFMLHDHWAEWNHIHVPQD